MREIVVHDHVRDLGLTVVVADGASVADVRDAAVARAGLPLRSFRGDDLAYALHVGDGPALDPTTPYPADADRSVTAHLRSDDASAVWAEVVTRSRALRDDVVGSVRGMADAATDELHAAVGRVRAAAEEEARALVQEATAGLEASLLERVRGLRRRVGLRREDRRRIVARVEELRATGALPTETRAASMAVGQLTSLAKAAVALPLAGAAAAATVTVGAVGAVGAIAGDGGDGKVARDDAAVTALEAQVADLEARLAAHVDDTADPHDTAPVAAVGAHVMDELGAEGPPATWVVSLLADADLRAAERSDRALATRFRESGVLVDVVPGEALWTLAERLLADERVAAACERRPDDDPSAADVARYVGLLWLHNAGVLGDDPDVIEPATRIQAVCP